MGLPGIFDAPEAEPLDLEALAAAPDNDDDSRLYLHPASRLLASDYPVFRIWQVNQAGYVGEDTVDLAMGGVRLLDDPARPRDRHRALERRGIYPLEPRTMTEPWLRPVSRRSRPSRALYLAATLSGYIARRIVVGLSS